MNIPTTKVKSCYKTCEVKLACKLRALTLRQLLAMNLAMTMSETIYILPWQNRFKKFTRTRRLPLYPGPGRGGSRLSRDAQTSLSPDTSSSSSGWNPRRSHAIRET
ncbi:hypothetical protein ATANTOWER_015112 [Ataeniobius toweri]|uniref:Uncharacterized protein n=1 Tax=Ataeniobius toweri TaxID=208326 RepID=A0ABU7BBB2_9TELE|nr:hypothetical protein [Ataeniobius toweri]